MGKSADKKLKRRRADALRQRRANTNERAALAALAESADRQREALADAVPADRKAHAARTSEVLDAMADYPSVAVAAVGFTRNLARATDGVRRTDGETVFPRLAAKVADLYARILDVPHGLCEHLESGPQPCAFRCAVCRDVDRLMCLDCLKQHDKTHTLAEEHRCDECGQVWMNQIAPVRPDPIHGVPVQRAGEPIPRALPSAVLVCSVGICNRCKAKAGKARARKSVTQQRIGDDQ